MKCGDCNHEYIFWPFHAMALTIANTLFACFKVFLIQRGVALHEARRICLYGKTVLGHQIDHRFALLWRP